MLAHAFLTVCARHHKNTKKGPVAQRQKTHRPTLNNNTGNPSVPQILPTRPRRRKIPLTLAEVRRLFTVIDLAKDLDDRPLNKIYCPRSGSTRVLIPTHSY